MPGVIDCTQPLRKDDKLDGPARADMFVAPRTFADTNTLLVQLLDLHASSVIEMAPAVPLFTHPHIVYFVCHGLYLVVDYLLDFWILVDEIREK